MRLSGLKEKILEKEFSELLLVSITVAIIYIIFSILQPDIAGIISFSYFFISLFILKLLFKREFLVKKEVYSSIVRGVIFLATRIILESIKLSVEGFNIPLFEHIFGWGRITFGNISVSVGMLLGYFIIALVSGLIGKYIDKILKLE